MLGFCQCLTKAALKANYYLVYDCKYKQCRNNGIYVMIFRQT